MGRLPLMVGLQPTSSCQLLLLLCHVLLSRRCLHCSPRLVVVINAATAAVVTIIATGVVVDAVTVAVITFDGSIAANTVAAIFDITVAAVTVAVVVSAVAAVVTVVVFFGGQGFWPYTAL